MSTYYATSILPWYQEYRNCGRPSIASSPMLISHVTAKNRGAYESGGQPLNLGNLVHAKMEAKNFQIGSHVLFVTGSGQGKHVGLSGEPKNNLLWAPVEASSDGLQDWASQGRGICG